jgi:murein DD-endopeptidase MepM/ murein hydrolase activator NlpD
MNALLAALALLSTFTGWPLSPDPEVVRPFEPPQAIWESGHRGVDLAASLGQQVYAARAGTVSFAGRIAGKAVVVVDHGTTRTTYEPVVARVRKGDIVAAGAPIGTVELFGSHCFPRACLHWGLIEGTEYLDPLTLVDAVPRVRLLPLTPSPTISYRPAAQTWAPLARPSLWNTWV